MAGQQEAWEGYSDLEKNSGPVMQSGNVDLMGMIPSDSCSQNQSSIQRSTVVGRKWGKNGHGRCFYKSSVVYEGAWTEGQRTGWATMYYEK